MLGARVLTIAGLIFAAAIAQANAQTWPSKPITIINPYPPGASVDQTARIIQPRLQAALGQQVIVDYKPGAAGNIGTAFAARAEPDGYTILLTTNAVMTLNPHVYTSIGFNAEKDLLPITTAVNGVLAVSLNPAVPAKTIAELVAYAKQHPREIFFGTAGIASPQHMFGEILNRLGGIELVHAPYKGGAPAVQDAVAGHIQMTIATLSSVVGQVDSGGLRAIAIGEKERFPGRPDLPTVAETYPGTVVTTWLAFFAPAGTPQPIIARLNTELVKILRDPDVTKQLLELALIPVADTPEQLGKVVHDDTERWGKLIKELNIKVE